MYCADVCVAPLSNLGRLVANALFPFAFWVGLAMYHLVAVGGAWMCSRLHLQGLSSPRTPSSPSSPSATMGSPPTSPTSPTPLLSQFSTPVLAAHPGAQLPLLRPQSPEIVDNDGNNGDRGSSRPNTATTTGPPSGQPLNDSKWWPIRRILTSLALADLSQTFRTRYLVLFLLTYMPILSGALSLVRCHPLANGVLYLANAPDVTCYDRWHMPAFVYGVVAIVVLVLAVPVALWRQLGGIVHGDDQTPLNSMEALYGGYSTQSTRSYPVFDLLKRVVVVAVAATVSRQTEGLALINVMAVVAVLWVFLLEHWYSKPLRSVLENNFRFLCSSAMVMVCCTSMLNLPATHPESDRLDQVRVSLLVAILVSPWLMVPWYGLRLALIRSHHQRRSSMSSTLTKVGTTSAWKERLLVWYRILGADEDITLTPSKE
ncbi:hypothetical protein BC828DRAFT_148707 [Blastocladiella britannica]|nr:hypothetical protein BC828DRAFT_148707 [Blastocladiella britannica]